MRVFTIIGVIVLIVGIALGVVACMPSSGGIDGMAANLGAGIAAMTLVPMGIIFTAIGVWFQRVTGGRRRLLETGIPGEARILDVSGGNVVVNNVDYLLTMRLQVTLPGRAPYEVRHREMVPIFQMANVSVGSVVPVRVDPADPTRLALTFGVPTTITVSPTTIGVSPTTIAVSPPAAPGITTATPVPNTLSSLAGVAPNTIAADAAADPLTRTHGHDATAASVLGGIVGGGLADQLSKWGVQLDPAALANAQVHVEQSTVDVGDGAQATLLATGRPGRAFIREASDTGVQVLGDAVMQLTLDVTPDGGAVYQVRTASLVPAAARSRALPGGMVSVRIDPTQPTNVAVDWRPG